MYSELLPVVNALTAALQERDHYTRHHSDRVCDLSIELGKACGLAEKDLKLLHVAALFHDIGKIGVPDNVLLKAGQLSSEEWVLMKEHPVQGERIIMATGLPIGTEVAKIVRHHHEAFDGSGYPDGLRGECIPLLARILTLADCYDAMSTVRPYRTAMSHEHIMDIFEQGRGTKFDALLLDKFIPILDTCMNRDLIAA